MIEAKDLRNGNLIIGKYEDEEIDGVFETVCVFLGYDPFNNHYWVNSNHGIEEFTSFDPIPLTNEWLIKLGFTIKIETTYSSGFKTEYNVYALNEITYNGIQKNWYYGNKKLDKKPEFIHELQNLYFALTKTELQLKQ